MFLFTILSILIIALISWYKKHFRRRDYLYSKIPHPYHIPLLHHSLEFIGKTPKELFDWMEDMSNELGNVYFFSTGIFGSGFAVISDVKIVEALLSSQVQLDKTIDYNYLIDWIGTGLLISNSKKWFTRRKLLTPGFHFKILERFVEIQNNQANVFVNILQEYDGKEVDIFPLASLYALDTVCEAAMGINIHAQTKQSDYLKAVQEITRIITIKSFDTTKQIEFLYRFTEMYRREKKLIEELHAFTDKIIQSRREELLMHNEETSEQNDEIGTKKKKALLDILLSSRVEGEPLKNSDIREEVDTFMFAGHDTSKSGICFVFYCIAKYPEVQQKVYEEIIEVLGDEEEINLQKLNELHYLELVIRESLRLFPPVPYYGRQLVEELITEKYTFPKGMNVYVSPYLMGRDERIFPEPKKFDPHRFEVEMANDKINPFSYVPFSAGPRNCIGQKFAQYEMRMIAAKVLRKFKLSIASEITILSELVLRPENGVNLKIEKRK
ncbi:hypothetical protein PVAND_012532 [Polypedilum vanderplanki]|uniref:Cytochrome P450 n=1 Tax=Polypedilum vanderplanki TaxID=319348 RepID=A0A9J6CN04_POLVA|nr:hypothetical protein PVAND_012532 [Polypedilum vanderplanki]